ncbi:hypothetical protein BS47DRAFT_1485161 [Hydnum rufescens UP504]|uniref:Exoribonuclease phosphorolytic domain-containing protein n=1 Tax=Hydnum rufescens UP504 TaxID=1448309 RepID=A0A9P6AZM3_9AGAM|nr:hypothetical protein BS47DRAFT_1485161 [Hydnum rufescens UP504]
MSQGYGFDRRRVNGPEWSTPPMYEDTGTPKAKLTKRVGRSPKDIRPIFITTGLISQANGSAYIETERLKIACAVYGPRQNKNQPYNEKGKLNVEVKFAPFASARRRAPMRDVEDRPTSVQIHQSLLPSLRLELFPKSTIDVFITILEADGDAACVASGSVAASAALADAGIEMLGLVAACSSCVFAPISDPSQENRMQEDAPIDEDWGQIWMDPNAEESARASSVLVMAGMPALGTVTHVRQTGAMSIAQASACLDICLQQCAAIHTVVSKALLDSARARESKDSGTPKLV